MTHLLDRISTELRDTARSLRVSAGVLAAAVLILALAAGAAAAMAGLVARGLLGPPALVASPERLFTLGIPFETENRGRQVMTTTSFLAFRKVDEGIAGGGRAAAFRTTSSAVLIAGTQREAKAVLVSGSYFDLLGVQTLFGRSLERDETGEAAPGVVLSHSFWRAAFGGDQSVLGQPLHLDGIQYIVLGVMPPGFSGHSTARVDVWAPLAPSMQSTPGWQHDGLRRTVGVLVRVEREASVAAVQDRAAAALEDAAVLQPVGSGADVSAVDRKIAFGLTALSMLVVVLALANAGTLLLVRAARLKADVAIRSALGASRARLLGHTATEAAVLALATGVLGSLAAFWLGESVQRVLLPGLAATEGPTRNGLSVACGAALLAGLGAIAAGASQLPRADAGESVSGGGRVLRGRSLVERGLLVVQVAVSVLLLAGFGMFGRSLYNLGTQEFGFRTDDVLMVDFPPGPSNHEEQAAVLREGLDRITALPGVTRATIIQAAPFARHHIPPISVPGLAEPPNAGGQLPYLTAATPEFLEIMGVQIVAGRGFSPQDDRGAPVVIVNESMARGAWPGETAVGKCIRIGFDPDFDPYTATGAPAPPTKVPCREVIGVARDLRQRSVVPTEHEGRLMQYFVPFSQVPPPPAGLGSGPDVAGLLLRVTTDVRSVAEAVRKVVVGDRADLPFLRVRTYREILGVQMQPWERGTQLLGMFAAVALVVAAVGLYAVFAHAVATRRQEMAIRVAVGADRGRVVRMILADAMRLAAVGVVVGTVSAALAGRSVAALLFGTSPTDPVVLLLAGTVMLLVAGLATWIPALTAARANPNQLLR